MRKHQVSRSLRTEQLEHRNLLTVLTPTLLADFSPGNASSSFSNFSPQREYLYFDVNGSELWRTNGTVEGTLQLANIDRKPGDTFDADGLGLTLFNVQTADGEALWRTDGSAAGTFKLADIALYVPPLNFNLRTPPGIDVRGLRIFHASSDGNTSLWVTDGTVDGTVKLTDGSLKEFEFCIPQSICPRADPQEALGLWLFNVATPKGATVWRTDGTVAGTFELMPNAEFTSVAATNDFALLEVETNSEATQQNVTQLVRSHGTARGTQVLVDYATSAPVANSTGAFFFGATKDGRPWLYKVDGVSSSPQQFIQIDGFAPRVLEDRILFMDIGRDLPRYNLNSTRLWSTDGTESEPSLLHEQIVTSDQNEIRSAPTGAVIDGAFVGYYPGGSNLGGVLFRTDGTPKSTRVLTTGLGAGHLLFNAHEMAYFYIADLGSSDLGFSVYRSDGNTVESFYGGDNGTAELDDEGNVTISAFSPRNNHRARKIFVDEIGASSFSGEDFYDEITTYQVGDTWYYRTSGGNWPNEVLYGRATKYPNSNMSMSSFGQLLETSSRRTDDPLFAINRNLQQLLAFDGSEHPKIVADINPNSLNYQYTDDGFFFTKQSANGEHQIWATNGTISGTVSADFPNAVVSRPQLLEWNGKSFVVADTEPTGRELWILDAEIPTVKAGRYTIDEGQPLQLAATVRDVSSSASVRWDIDGDGEFDDAVGTRPLVSWQELTSFASANDRRMDDGSFAISVRLESPAGLLLEDTGRLFIRNLDPKVRVVVSEETELRQIEVTVDANDADESLAYSFTVGSQRTTQSDPTFLWTPARPGLYPLTVAVEDADGGKAEWNGEVAVGRFVELNTTYEVDEGLPLQLSVVDNGIDDEATYAWDIDGDGDYDDASGPAPVLTWAELAAFEPPINDGGHNIALRVVNKSGEIFEDRSQVRIVNHPPRVRTVLPPNVYTGIPATLEVVASDADEIVEYSIRYVREDRTTSQASPYLPLLFSSRGRQSVQIKVTDSDGDSTLVNVTAVVLPNADANQDLVVDFADFLLLAANFGKQVADLSSGDFDDNGVVDFRDFLILSERFGTTIEIE